MPRQNPNRTPGKLYCVATPIGNLEDLSPRARLTLSQVDIVAAEDTRKFKLLCSALNLKTRGQVISYYDAKEIEKSALIIEHLLQGKSVALVSDAGTPNISDPGYRLLALAFENQIEVTPIPGCSSVAAALSICPLPGVNFCFYGFPPSQSSARKNLFAEINFKGRIVFFESPHRLIGHLNDAQEVWGAQKTVFITRELTKKFEESAVHSLQEWLEHYKNTPPKGEFVLIYDGESIGQKDLDETNLDQWLQEQLDKGQSAREVLKDAQSRFKINRKEIYNKIMRLKENK